MKLWSVLSHWIPSLMLIVKVGNCCWYQSLSWLNTFNGFTAARLNKADWNNNGGILKNTPQFEHLHSGKNWVVLTRVSSGSNTFYGILCRNNINSQWRGNFYSVLAGQETAERAGRPTICSQCKCIEREWQSLPEPELWPAESCSAE